MPEAYSRTPLYALATIVVLASGIAAYFGASLAPRTPVEAVPARPVDPATLESVDRRIGYLKDEVEKLAERVDALEVSVRERAEAAAQESPKSESPAPASPSAPTASEPSKAETPPQSIDDGAAGQMATLKEIYRKNLRSLLVGTMKIYADTSEEGARRRFAQGTSDGDGLVRRFGLDMDKSQEPARRILREQWEQASREIGPLVRDGLEKADVGTVRDRLRKIHADTDQKLRPLFDDEKWKQYQDVVTPVRKATEEVLEEFDRSR
jgi:hypothetical protein